jgi:hypothetical protein
MGGKQLIGDFCFWAGPTQLQICPPGALQKQCWVTIHLLWPFPVRKGEELPEYGGYNLDNKLTKDPAEILAL